MVYKRRKAPNMNSASYQPRQKLHLYENRPPSDWSGICEVHGSHQVELCNDSTPSGSGNESTELPEAQVFPPVELGTYHRTLSPSDPMMIKDITHLTANTARGASPSHSTPATSATPRNSRSLNERAVIDLTRRISKRRKDSHGLRIRLPPRADAISYTVEHNKALPQTPAPEAYEPKISPGPPSPSIANPWWNSKSASRPASCSRENRGAIRELYTCPPSTPISESVRVSPVIVRHESRASRGYASGGNSTYALVFDFEEVYGGAG